MKAKLFQIISPIIFGWVSGVIKSKGYLLAVLVLSSLLLIT